MPKNEEEEEEYNDENDYFDDADYYDDDLLVNYEED